MMLKKFVAALCAVAGICSAAAAVYIGMNFTDREPQLLTPPTVARNQVVTMMEAVCGGDYDAASAVILGTPDLGMSREAADEVGVLVWEAFQESLTYELSGECYTTSDGLAQDITVTGLDIESVTANLHQRSRELLEKRVEEAEDISEVYDENNEYREEFVMDVLYDAAEEALREDAQLYTAELTIRLSYTDGNWWVVADSALLDAISGGILY